jgi:hypothetical protein
MTTKGQILVALAATALGLVSVGAYWLIARPEANNATVAIGTLIYAAAYVLAVPRLERRLMRNPALVINESNGLSRG